MSKIAIFVNNSLYRDQRVIRQISFLASQDNQIDAYGVLTSKDSNYPILPTIDNVNFHLVDRRRSNLWGWLISVLPVKISSVLLASGIRGKIIDKFSLNSTYFLLYFKAKPSPAEIYIANDLDTTGIAYKLSKKYKAKLVYDAHEYYYGQAAGEPLYLKEAIERHEKYICHNASTIVTVSDSIAHKLALKYGIGKPIVVRNIGRYIKLNNEESIVHTPTRLLYHSANLELTGRNLKILIDALALLKDRVRFSLRGKISGSKRKELLNYLKENLRNHEWDLLDAVDYDELILEASKNDVGFVLNSPDNENHNLTLPNKVFEYMNAGLAIISFDTIEMRKVVLNSRVGLICENLDSESLYLTIHELIHDKRKILEFKMNSSNASKVKYSWAIESSNLNEILND